MRTLEKRVLSVEKNGFIVKIGEGELGGKALSFSFLESVADLQKISAKIAPHEVRIPETWVLATEIFDEFMKDNDLEHCIEANNDEEVRIDFLNGKFSSLIIDILKEYLETHKGPIAVRSSALSEDAATHPAAGLFCTFMLPNNSSTYALNQLQDAIKLVFASLYTKEAREYLKLYNIPHENEKMAVILEEVIGNPQGNYFFPIISGVAQSLNFFPVGNIKTDDGVATIALGLGCKIVDGHGGMRFCPKYPTLRPQFRSIPDIISMSQEDFYAVDLTKGSKSLCGSETETLHEVNVNDIPSDLLDTICSVLDLETSILRDAPTTHPGERVLTFNQFIKQSLFPLPNVISNLLTMAQDGFGTPVELEFAIKFEPFNNTKKYILYLLQARSMSALKLEQQVEIPEVSKSNLILKTDKILGHGSIDSIKYIIFVDPKDFDISVSPHIAREIAYLNEMLSEKKEKFLLLGPGRWGSCNPGVGIPVTYAQVSGAKLIAEISTEYLRMEPSQGSHFFHNVVSGGVFYLTVDDISGGFANLELLRQMENTADTHYAKLLCPASDIFVRVDAHARKGVVFF